MLHQRLSLAHGIALLLQLGSRFVENVFLFPALDLASSCCRAVRLECTGPTTLRPVNPQGLTFLAALTTLAQAFPGRADVLVALCVITEVRLRVTTFGLGRERKSAISGTGIGLAVVRELTRAMGGRCWADSKNGGARVNVEFSGDEDRE